MKPPPEGEVVPRAAQARVLWEPWATSTGRSGGARVRREDAYDGRLRPGR